MNCNATPDPLEQAAETPLATDLPAAPGGDRAAPALPATSPALDSCAVPPDLGAGPRGVGAIASFAGMWHALLGGLSSTRRWAVAVV